MTTPEPTDKFTAGNQEPVITAGAFIVLVNSVLVLAIDALASYFNVTPELRLFLIALGPALVTAYFLVGARSKVTPNTNPRTPDGEKLIPESQAVTGAIVSGEPVLLQVSEVVVLPAAGASAADGTAVILE